MDTLTLALTIGGIIGGLSLFSLGLVGALVRLGGKPSEGSNAAAPPVRWNRIVGFCLALAVYVFLVVLGARPVIEHFVIGLPAVLAAHWLLLSLVRWIKPPGVWSANDPFGFFSDPLTPEEAGEDSTG